ncbi:MAG TPA: right-handed parallel beta-helix repeat-containing protein [Thermoanaerobaculia bacterium]|nr:right-handed parallel beta-helix repeat-containing protein [Thermoanaerobaculia bacterium]
MRIAGLLCALFLAANASAVSLNVGVFTYRNDRQVFGIVPAGSDVRFNVYPNWTGGVPHDVEVEIDVPGTIVAIDHFSEIECQNRRPVSCRINPTTDGYNGLISITTHLENPGEYRYGAKIRSADSDPFPNDNEVSSKLEVVEHPVFSVDASGPSRIDPAKPGKVGASLFNSGSFAERAVLTLTLPEGGTFTGAHASGPAVCEVEVDRVVCTASLDFQESFFVLADVIAPGRLDGGTMKVRATAAGLTHETSTRLVRHLLVTNASDEGAGSLRQALLDARDLCDAELCTVDFRVATPDPLVTIRPATPLPEVRGFVKVDGATQTEFGGDTNPDGPEIEINGSLLEQGDGLVLRSSCDIWVLDLAINDFPRHAIELIPDNRLAQCPSYAPNSPRVLRNQLRGNERGVVMSGRDILYIEDNLITGNRRAGIFLGDGYYASIRRNRITHNGASGVFLNVGKGAEASGAGVDVEENVIAHNGEWGVARTPAGFISLTANSIFDNQSQGIDIGLDNETPNRASDGNTTPNKPELLSATYDPAANATVVRGRLDSVMRTGIYIDVYASAGLSRWGFPEGETPVATKQLLNSRADFEIVVPSDLRGKYITATNTRAQIVGWAKPPQEQSHQSSVPRDTSEFSNAVVVR